MTWAVLVGCTGIPRHNLPPAERLMHPGPGVDGPGPGVMIPPGPMAVGSGTSQVYFQGPEGMEVAWDEVMTGSFDSSVIAPGRSNFARGRLFRMRLTNVPGYEGEELFPTLEVAPATPRSEAFLAHNSIPVFFTEEDFEQVRSGNFVTKVIYLPDPEFQELALAGVETLVSTRLDPGVDPVVEADRRGAILGIVRLGNKDLMIAGGDLETGIMQAGFTGSFAGEGCFDGSGMGGAYMAGMGSGQYGMPITGTPIGLPGPPHVPLGGPAGLQKHVMKNHTLRMIPKPTRKQTVHMRQVPGQSYPRPPKRTFITELTAPARRMANYCNDMFLR